MVRRSSSLRAHSGEAAHAGLFWFALALLCGLTVSPAWAESAIEGELRAVLATVPHTQTVTGACVVDLASGATVFAHQADLPLIPASNMKVFVMAAALGELGPDFAFETVLATDGANLYLIGDGDPALGDEKLHRSRGEEITADFERWADALRARGMSAFRGDLLVDDSIFDGRRLHPTWEERDLGKWYAVPVGGLNFNDNCVDITVTPGREYGEPVAVAVQPSCPSIKIVNQCRSGGKGPPVLRHRHDTFEYRITGRCSKPWPFPPVSFPDPALLTADSLRTVFRGKGLHLGGTIRRGRIRQADGRPPSSLTVVGRRRTPLGDVLCRSGKDSQNLFADCLLKRAGYAWAKRRRLPVPQGSWITGSRAILDTLHQAGINSTNLAIADGSGLSRENRCTARQLVAVLAWMSGRKDGRVFQESLSVAGVDGSLQKRLRDIPGRVYGKTGTMRGVRTLSGYVEGSDDRPYAFAILFNGYPGPSTPYREIQDRFCRVLVK